jgi:hypothetical protein
MKMNDLTSFLLSAAVIGVGVASASALFTPLMSRLGITQAVSGASA